MRTSMHSSRMRTAHLLTVWGVHPGGGGLHPGRKGSASRREGCLYPGREGVGQTPSPL